MDEAVAVRDIMDRSYVGVSEGDTVAGAAGLMDDEGVDSAIVLRGNDPVGMLRAVDVVSLVARGNDAESTTVESAMIDAVASIEADAPVAEVVDVIAGDGPRRTVVTEDGDVTGVVTDHDIVTTHTILQDTADPNGPQTTPGGSIDDNGYGDQGVCEICGSLSHDLTEQNGQLVCGECLPV